MQRGGRTHKPVYTIVATDSRNPRDGRFNEKLGQYDPNREEVLSAVNAERITALVAQGATMSDTVRSLLKRNKISVK
jgi:small subunit ribosomal protein S16